MNIPINKKKTFVFLYNGNIIFILKDSLMNFSTKKVPHWPNEVYMVKDSLKCFIHNTTLVRLVFSTEWDPGSVHPCPNQQNNDFYILSVF